MGYKDVVPLSFKTNLMNHDNMKRQIQILWQKCPFKYSYKNGTFSKKDVFKVSFFREVQSLKMQFHILMKR